MITEIYTNNFSISGDLSVDENISAAKNISGSSLTISGDISSSRYLFGDGRYITDLSIDGRTITVSDPLKFDYVGDGSTTSFPITGTSGSVNPALVQVFVENVRQEPYKAYTLSTSAVEFSAAPLVGEAIYILTPNVSLAEEPIRRFDYVLDDVVSYSYSGIAIGGSLETDPVWDVTKITYTDVGDVTSTQYANSISWTDRLTATYY